MGRAFWCLALVVLLIARGTALAAPPAITTPVTDIAGAVDAEDEDRIASALVQLRQGGGPQMAVVFVRTTEGQPIEDYTLRVAEAWGGGTKELDSGVVLLIALEDRRSRLEVGYGLEASIPDAKARGILDGMRDDLRAERPGDAALRAIREVAAATGRPAPSVAARKTPYPAKPPPAAAPTAPPPRPPMWQTPPIAGPISYIAGILAGVLATLILRRPPAREIPLTDRTDEQLLSAIRGGPPRDTQKLARWLGALLCVVVVVGAGALALPPATFIPFAGAASLAGFAAALIAGRRESPVKALLPAPLALVWGFAGVFSFAFDGGFSALFGGMATFIALNLFNVTGGSTSIGSSSVRYRSDDDEVRSFFTSSSSGSSSSSSSSSLGSSFGSSSSGSSSSGSGSSGSSSSSTNWSGGGGGFGGGGASSSW